MKPIQIVQITDTHLFADNKKTLKHIQTNNSLAKVLQDTKRHNIDAIFITGDISQDETVESYQYLENLCKKYNIPTYVTPGNHDNIKNMKQVFNQESFVKFDKIWRMGNWQIILLNSKVENEVLGTLSLEELEFLRIQLAISSRYYTLVGLHHQPVSIGSEWIDAYGLTNSKEFITSAAHFPQIRGIFWGHIHQAYQHCYKGSCLFATPSTCTQFDPTSQTAKLDQALPGYRHFTLYPDGEMTSHVWRVHPFLNQCFIGQNRGDLVYDILIDLGIKISLEPLSYQLVITDERAEVNAKQFIVDIKDKLNFNMWEAWVKDKNEVQIIIQTKVADEKLKSYLYYLLTGVKEGDVPYITD